MLAAMSGAASPRSRLERWERALSAWNLTATLCQIWRAGDDVPRSPIASGGRAGAGLDAAAATRTIDEPRRGDAAALDDASSVARNAGVRRRRAR